MFNTIWQGFSRLVYPPYCLLCQKYIFAPLPMPLVCPACQQHIILNHPPFCLHCSRPTKKPYRQARCRECRQHNLSFDFAWSACLYEDPLKKLIHLFKYNQKTGLRHLLSDIMIKFIQQYNLDITQFDLIIPIPLSPTRLRERGYNQTDLLATQIGKVFDITVATHLMKRIRHTRSQTLLDEKQRWTNIQGAFRIGHSNAVRYKNILLIDDLLTTGATASEASQTLKNAGAGTVGVLTLAITAEKS